MDDQTKNLVDVAISIIQVLLLAGAGVWAYFRFIRERTHAPRIRFDLACRFHGPQAGAYLAEFRLIIRNEGIVIHRFSEISLRVRGIECGAAIEQWEAHPPRAVFPIKIVDDRDVIHKAKYEYVFVEPGVEQEISYVAPVDDGVSLVLARAEFTYGRDQARTHSAERVFSVRCADAAQPADAAFEPPDRKLISEA